MITMSPGRSREKDRLHAEILSGWEAADARSPQIPHQRLRCLVQSQIDSTDFIRFVSGNNQARSLRWTKRPSPAFLLFDCPTASIHSQSGKPSPHFDAA